MTRALTVISAGPGATLQDFGRPGHLGHGLSRSGAMDAQALSEGAALLGQPDSTAALELPAGNASFEANCDLRIALTGAPLEARIGEQRLQWNASHPLPAGARLTLGRTLKGSYGYLHVGGGFDTPPWLGSRAAHLAAGIGKQLTAGDILPLGEDAGRQTGLGLEVEDRFSGGTLRVVPTAQTAMFAQEVRDRFEATEFSKDLRANRMGTRMNFDGPGFHSAGQRSILSEIVVPGDIQVTGDGTPFVLMPECQTSGGYPRIGTVLPADLGRVAQAPAGAPLRFRFLTLDEGLEVHRAWLSDCARLASKAAPLVRDPRDIPDLLSYQLIGGVLSATDPNLEEPQ